MAEGAVDVVGLHGGEWFGAAAGAAVRAATTLIGASRHLDALDASVAGRRVPLGGSLAAVLDDAASRVARGERVCLLASGDPGFFGLARLASARLGAERVRVHPAPSSVAVAFARVGLAWDDAVVVSAHGRPLAPVVAAVASHPKVAVLVSADQPPQALGRELLSSCCAPRRVVVASRLGEAAERLWEGDLAALAEGTFDPVSVVLALVPDPVPGPAPAGAAGWSWGLPDDRFAHRDGMITKAEVRAVALGKLGLPAAGVLWDVGAGSGSVAVESARARPGLRVFAVERRADDCARIAANAAGTAVAVVEGEAPAALAGLPDPDRVFVGGGGLGVLDAVLDRLRPGGTVVATYAALDRAAAAGARLGSVVQVAISRGVRVGADGALRLDAENPVFVCWGPG